MMDSNNKQNEILINCLLSAVHFDFPKREKEDVATKPSMDVVERLRMVKNEIDSRN